MKPRFLHSHFQRSTFSDDPNKQTCFECARLDGVVAIRDSKNEAGSPSDAWLFFEAVDFDAFLTDVRGTGTFAAFLRALASGALTERCFRTTSGQSAEYPYEFASVEEPDAGVLRFSEAEMETFYRGVMAGEFVDDTVPHAERSLVFA